MKTITPEQIKTIQTFCSGKFKSREERLEAIGDLVGSEIDSVKDLTSIQADDLIYFFKTGNIAEHSTWAFYDYYNTQHKAILSLCYQNGWVQKDNPNRIDLERLGGWLKSAKSPVKKPLKEMDKKELSKIITAMQNMLR
jgi:hypothetical protein